MQRHYRLLIVLGIFLAASFFSSGCAYLKNRVNDASDLFDMGISLTKDPKVGVYGSFNSLLGVGYADLKDGKLLGLGQRNIGLMDMRFRAAGSVIEGYEQYAYDGNYKKEDKTTPPKRGVGLGLIYHEKPRNIVEALQCAKILHLGWIGIIFNCRVGEFLDFLLGLMTLDIAEDDTY